MDTTSPQQYEQTAKEVGILQPVTANKAYMDGYNGVTTSVHAQPSSIGLGKTLYQQYLKGKADKEAGRPASPPNVMAQAVKLPGARRHRKKTKKGKRKGKKSSTRRR